MTPYTNWLEGTSLPQDNLLKVQKTRERQKSAGYIMHKTSKQRKVNQ